ncbi:MORN-repeat protein, partial [Orpheovirus IHUMI-LCC2]
LLKYELLINNMDLLTSDILFYKICYGDYQTAIVFSQLCKRFNKLSKEHNREKRNIRDYFLINIRESKRRKPSFNGESIHDFWVDRMTGKLQGPYSKYLDGNLYKRYYYNDGLRDGRYTRYNKDKKIFETVMYVNGKMEGEFIGYDEDKIYETRFYVNGKKEGAHTTWHENGNKYIEMNFKDGKFHGPWTSWHKNGQVLDSKYYVDNCLHGEHHSYHDNGILREYINYNNGRKDGKYVSYYKTGRIKGELTYSNGNFVDGEARWYHANGNICNIDNYKNEKLYGKCMEWHENGRKKKECTYVDYTVPSGASYYKRMGTINGVYIKWYDTGIKEKECNYVNGRKVGECVKWDKKGNVVSRTVFYP